jgi:hypothetical protein
MLDESSSGLPQFRVTVFVGPQTMEGKPSTYCTVFNVKKRSWKGGIQVAVEIDQAQIDSLCLGTGFRSWLTEALTPIAAHERSSYEERAQELFIQAISWCKLELLLYSGITQGNQCLSADTFVAELNDVARTKRQFITNHVATELDLSLPDDTA